MIEISNVWTGGFEGSLRGCRMPYESFDKSDSGKCPENCSSCIYGSEEIYDENAGDLSGESWWSCLADDDARMAFSIGSNDMALCKKLIKGGPEHRKFLRMIHVQFDIRMPRYFATQLDTYKVGTVKNSSSTMHLITKRELTIDDFTADGYARFDLENTIIPIINKHIRNYNEGIVDKSDAFRAIKQLLPESFMQKATYDMTYETLLNIYRQRKNHRLPEWHAFSDWCLTLPYFKEFVE